MSKHFIFLSLVIFLSDNLFSQQKCGDTLHIDFASLKKEYKCTVEYKKAQVIQIMNINRKVFNVEEGKVEKDFNTEIPAAFKAITLPSFISLGGLPKPAKPLPPTNNLVGDFNNNPEQVIESGFEEIKRRVKKLNQGIFFYNDINGLSKNCLASAADIRQLSNKLADIYLHGKTSTPSPNFPTLIKTLDDTLHNLRIGAERILEELKSKIGNYTTGIKNKLKSEITTYKDQIVQDQKVLLDKSSTRLQKEKSAKAIKVFDSLITAREKELKAFSETEKGLNDNLKEAEGAVAEMYAFEKEDKIRTIIDTYRLVNHSNSFTYTAKLNKAKKDKATYTFTVTPKELNECTTEDKKIIEVELLTTGGCKIDFSTGAFVNFGNEDFLGPSYYYKNLSDSTRQIVSAERDPRLMLSVGALMHLYKRTVSSVKIGGSVGVSTTADFETFNFHAGPSIIFGNENRFILTAGITLKSSPQLDQQLETNKTYTHLESPDAIPTVDVFPKVGGFISITYNVSRFGKE